MISEKKKSWFSGGGPAVRPSGKSLISADKSTETFSSSNAEREPKDRTEQLNLQPNLRQCMHKASGLLTRHMSPISSQHVQPVCPIRPSTLIRCNHIRQAAFMRTQQRKASGTRNIRHRRCGQVRGVAKDVRGGKARPCDDLAYHRDVNAVGEVFQPISYGELDCTVDEMEVLVCVVLLRKRELASGPVGTRRGDDIQVA